MFKDFFQNKTDSDIFISYLAATLQNPDLKLDWHILIKIKPENFSIVPDFFNNIQKTLGKSVKTGLIVSDCTEDFFLRRVSLNLKIKNFKVMEMNIFPYKLEECDFPHIVNYLLSYQIPDELNPFKNFKPVDLKTPGEITEAEICQDLIQELKNTHGEGEKLTNVLSVLSAYFIFFAVTVDKTHYDKGKLNTDKVNNIIDKILSQADFMLDNHKVVERVNH